MKFFQVSFLFLVFSFSNGCIQTTALLGPGITVVTSGNIMQAGLQYGANTAIKKETGKDPFEHIKDAVGNKKENEEFKLKFKEFVKKRYSISK